MKRKKPVAIQLGQQPQSCGKSSPARKVPKVSPLTRTFEQTISADNLLRMLYVMGSIQDSEEIVSVNIQGIDIKVLPDQSIPLKITVKQTQSATARKKI